MSEGESFTIADPNEVWVVEMIGKGFSCGVLVKGGMQLDDTGGEAKLLPEYPYPVLARRSA